MSDATTISLGDPAKLAVDLCNTTDLDNRDWGWVGVLDGGGWFFPLPDGLRIVGGHIAGKTTLDAVKRAISEMEEDEISRPDGLDMTEAERLVREALEAYAV